MPIWRRLERHWVLRASSRARPRPGKSNPTNNAIITITTNNSISVNARRMARPPLPNERIRIHTSATVNGLRDDFPAAAPSKQDYRPIRALFHPQRAPDNGAARRKGTGAFPGRGAGTCFPAEEGARPRKGAWPQTCSRPLSPPCTRTTFHLNGRTAPGTVPARPPGFVSLS